ncbi:COX15-CtaA-domain-containing protein [Exidia glandulosa HHB12029]|uniref:COX15-CtaA-domain-containing protein n=1 Tax=Exidia glandulosa HHB12029 TaxID=1314781 RepID=A0A166BTI7_EXIGL|nr:COX15-CtaA-domain-containing protein [Exidia glandulosa HHB12029]
MVAVRNGCFTAAGLFTRALRPQPALRRPLALTAGFAARPIGTPAARRFLSVLPARTPAKVGVARRFFSPNSVLSAPRFFSANAALADDGVLAGEAAEPAIAPSSVGWWLLASAGLVYAIVVVGGLTRLTESGLSITEWKPVTGIVPPLSDAAWEEEFAKYKNSPEFVQLNSRMNVDDFKRIFFMEWTHRLLGRLSGVALLLPYGYFLARGRLPRPLPGMIGGFVALIGAQGALGWYMVKSGLHEDLFEPGAVPRVSQYRLAAHLGLAVALYAGMLHAGLRVLWDNKFVRTGVWSGVSGKALPLALSALNEPRLKAFRRNVWFVTGMVLVTAISGAFVAGLDAGLVYNEFPTMGGRLAPPTDELFSLNYAKNENKSDIWRNMFENPTTVQFNHRVLAMSTYTAACALYFTSHRTSIRVLLPPLARKLASGMFFVANAQVLLGIGTLLYLVPVHLAATHQAGSVALLSTVLALGMALRSPSAAAMILRRGLR